MVMSNPQTKLCTCIYNVVLANLSTTKEITELSNRHKDYVSVLVLPFEKNAVNEEVKYFLFSENHFEFNEHKKWTLPNLMAGKVKQYIRRQAIWTERTQCEKYIGKKVLHLEGKYEGKVVSFHYRRGVIGMETAVWTVKYVKKGNDNSSRRTYKRVEYSYQELMDIVLQ